MSKNNFGDLQLNDAKVNQYFDDVGKEFDSTKDMMANLYVLKETYKMINNTCAQDRKVELANGVVSQNYREISAILKQIERRGKVGAFRGHDNSHGKTHEKTSPYGT